LRAEIVSENDARDEIERLEARIERLSETAAACGKLIALGRAAALIGALWTLALFLGALRFDPVHMIAAFTLAVGGLVAMGSNASTREETLRAIAEAEARRAELIGALDLHLVEQGA
jgi:hypothetical protein